MRDESSDSDQPAPEGFDSWNAYWSAQGMAWRTEPEIDGARQIYLAERREIHPDAESNIFPFRDQDGPIKLTRADVEWLLATQKSRNVGEPIGVGNKRNLSHKKSGIFGTGINFSHAELSGVNLSGLDFSGAVFDHAFLDEACLVDAKMWFAFMRDASFTRANLTRVDMSGCNLSGANFEEAILRSATVSRSGTVEIHVLEPRSRTKLAMRSQCVGTTFSFSDLSDAVLMAADLTDAILSKAVLIGADCNAATLVRANLLEADLQSAYLRGVDLRGACLEQANLAGADCRNASMDATTVLAYARLDDRTLLADVDWNGAPLTLVDWSAVRTLGDDQRAKEGGVDPLDDPQKLQSLAQIGAQLGHKMSIVGAGFPYDPYVNLKRAMRGNRQLANALREQGMNEQADHFAYHAQIWQREVLRRQGIRKTPTYLASLLLWALSGYGYRLWRIVATYGAVVLVFSFIFWSLGVHSFPHESGIQAFWDSFLVSLSAIHGRTTFEQLGAWSPAAWTAAVESVFGIVIEGVFVAMLIQRFFAR